MTSDGTDFDFEKFQSIMAEQMKWATLSVNYREISEECVEISNELKHYELKSVTSSIGALLTLPEYQSNCIRLEILSCLAVLHCSGEAEAGISKISEWFVKIGKTRCVLGEDPSEDVFVSLVHYPQGNTRILEGIWENAGFYTQAMMDVLETFPERSDFQVIKYSFQALLKVGEEICNRSGLDRYVLGCEIPKDRIDISDLQNLESFSSRVIFSLDEINNLGISRNDLSPFVIISELIEDALDQQPGDSHFEFQPIIELPDGSIVVFLPSALTLAARHLLISFVVSSNLIESFDKIYASYIYRKIYQTPLLGQFSKLQLNWRRKNSVSYSEIGVEFENGYVISFHFFLPSIDFHFPGGFPNVIVHDSSVRTVIEESLGRLADSVERTGRFKAGSALVVPCGWGKGAVSEDISFNRNGWSVNTIALPDLIRLSWTNDISPEHFLRFQRGFDAASSMGIEFHNLNGILNMIAWSQSQDGHFIPHGALLDIEYDPDHPFILNIPQNELRKLRAEADQSHDRHRARDHKGRWHVVQVPEQRPLFKSEKAVPVFASMDDLEERQLTALVEWPLPVWFTIDASEFEDREIIYHLWRMGHEWLSRTVPVISMEASEPECRDPVLINLCFEGSGKIELTGNRPDAEQLRAMMHVDTGHEPGRYNIVFSEGFLGGFRHPHNIAERIVVEGLVRALTFDNPVSPEMINRLISMIVPNEDARSFHAMQAQSFLQFVAEDLPEKLVTLNPIDDAVVKLGLGVRALPNKRGGVISGRKKCTRLLNEIVDELISEIKKDLSVFDRKQVLKFAYYNLEKADAEEDHWRRTSAAVLGLYGDNPETLRAYVERSSSFSAAAVCSRILIEMAICECPIDSGVEVSRLDFSLLMARASLLYRFGGLSDAIQYNALAAELHISPFGDILFKDDFGEIVVEPMLSKVIGERYRNLAPDQKKNYYDPVVTESIQAEFDQDFWETFREEMGFDIAEGRRLIEVLEEIAAGKGKAVLDIRRSELENLLSQKIEDLSLFERFLDRFSITHREEWEKVPDGIELKEIYPWRFGRQLSLVSRPIVYADQEQDPSLIISPNTILRSFALVVSGAYYGTLDRSFFTTPRMKDAWLGTASEGHTFTRKTAEKLRKAGWSTAEEITLSHLLNIKLERDFGDVDVLAWRKDISTVLVIECKDLSLARNYTEIAHMLSVYQGQKISGEPDKLKRHLDRFNFISRNADKVKRFCGIDEPKLISVLACSGVVPMQYAQIDALQGSHVGSIETLIDDFT